MLMTATSLSDDDRHDRGVCHFDLGRDFSLGDRAPSHDSTEHVPCPVRSLAGLRLLTVGCHPTETYRGVATLLSPVPCRHDQSPDQNAFVSRVLRDTDKAASQM